MKISQKLTMFLLVFALITNGTNLYGESSSFIARGERPHAVAHPNIQHDDVAPHPYARGFNRGEQAGAASSGGVVAPEYIAPTPAPVPQPPIIINTNPAPQ